MKEENIKIDLTSRNQQTHKSRLDFNRTNRPIEFGYTIIYVTKVLNLLTFFETAFGFSKKFLDKSGTYGEIDTRETTLSLAAHSLGASNLPNSYISAKSLINPFELNCNSLMKMSVIKIAMSIASYINNINKTAIT